MTLPLGQTRDRHPLILVVDDDDDCRLLMRTLLEMSDYRVVEASNGLDAVEIAKVQRPDLILMDLTLPFLNGLSATIRIREHTELGEMPIVALSGHSTSDFFSFALSAGCNEYLVKPINFDRLNDVLNRLLPKN